MLKPTTDWIVTKPMKSREKVTNSGILLVTKQQEAVKLVRIVSFGPEANEHSQLKVGDVVMVPTQTGIKVEYENETYEMAKEKNFLGVME